MILKAGCGVGSGGTRSASLCRGLKGSIEMCVDIKRMFQLTFGFLQ